MPTPDPIDARARFLAAVGQVPAEAIGAARLCAACVLALPIRSAAIAIQVQGVGLEVLSATDPIAEKIEWTQVALGEGPGIDAVASCGPVALVGMVRPDGRWPMFTSEIAESGIGAMYALPLQLGAVNVGVLDLYCGPGESLAGPEFADAVAVAELLTAVLLRSDLNGPFPETLGPWWNQPPGTREVHQATGIIVAQLGVDARSAYAQLQAFAFANGRKLSDVAHDVVGRTLRFPPDADRSDQPTVPPSWV